MKTTYGLQWQKKYICRCQHFFFPCSFFYFFFFSVSFSSGHTAIAVVTLAMATEKEYCPLMMSYTAGLAPPVHKYIATENI